MNIKIIPILFVYFAVISCYSGEKKKELNSENSIVSYEDTVRVTLSNVLSVNWDNNKYTFVNDSLLQKALVFASRDTLSLLNQIPDSSPIAAKMCNLDRNLVTGDFAFMIIDEVISLPYSSVFNVQFDVFDYECEYPSGLLEHIHNDREQAKRKMMLYLNQQ